jgi:hypothetical protein
VGDKFKVISGSRTTIFLEYEILIKSSQINNCHIL